MVRWTAFLNTLMVSYLALTPDRVTTQSSRYSCSQVLEENRTHPRGCINLRYAKRVTECLNSECGPNELVDPVIPSQTLVRLLESSGLQPCFSRANIVLRDRLLLLALSSGWRRDCHVNSVFKEWLLLAFMFRGWSRDYHAKIFLKDRLLLAWNHGWSRGCHANTVLNDGLHLALSSGSRRDCCVTTALRYTLFLALTNGCRRDWDGIIVHDWIYREAPA